jgi:hypothetical protein
MQNVGRPESLALNDWRLPVAAELVAGGDVLGKVIVLGPKLAVTTLSAATTARTKVATAQRISATNPAPALGPLVSGPLALMFPQFRTSSGPPPAVAATLDCVDEELRFGVLSLPGTLPRQLPSGLLGTGELPADGATCSVVYADDPEVAFYGLSGQIEQAAEESSFYIYLGDLPADHSQLMGAPVFFEDRLIGMVVGGPARSVSGAFVGALSIRGMALSDVTPSVRALLPWIPDDSANTGARVVASPALAKNAKDGATAVSSLAAPDAQADLERGEERPPGWSDEGFLARLQEAAKRTVEFAEGMRRASGHNRLRMEHLVGALYGGWSGLFLRRGVKGPEGLNEIFVKVGVAPVEYEGSPAALAALPPRVGDVQRAFVAAARMADERGEKSIWDRDLLNGAFSIEGNRVIRALAEVGLTRERIARDSGAVAARENKAAETESTTSPLPEDVDGLADGGSEQTRAGSSSTDAQGGSAPQAKTAGEAATSEKLWARMMPSARRVFERAMGMMQQSKAVPGIETPADKKESNSLHMEFLIAALFESQKESFLRAKIDRSELRRILRQAVGTTIPEDYQSQQLDALPETSEHVGMAIAEAGKYATKQRARHINDSHLLHGAMFVQDCRVTGALTDAGMRWQNLSTHTDPDDLEAAEASVSKDQQVLEKPISAAPVADLKVQTRIVGESTVPTAAPTPKVDSDLWCETDKLGYEGYARTIAGLITHPETVPPLTIGIKAPWGAGKTSLMKRVQHLLDGRAELSEGNRSGARQQGQAPQLTMGRLRSELKEIARDEQGTSGAWSSIKRWLWRRLGKTDKPVRLPTPSNVEGAAYGLPPRVTVWFNAWKYQTSEQIWAGMAHCIISQVTARMPPLDRELFWLRLHARRINTDEVRRKVHGVLLRALAPAALMIVVACAIVVWLSATVQILIPHQWSVRVVTSLAGLIGVIWKARDTLGEKAAGTMKELVREPDYEGKMGYLHLVESDIREVLNLVTGAGVESKVEASSSQSQNPHFSQQQGEVGHPVVPTREKEKPTPLVVFVDDLDRCAPNKVAEVVEAINLFLCGDYPNCIFVLGMEPGMVAAALEVANKDVIAKAREMGLVDGAAPVGWRFMEKIVQMPVMIPPPTRRGRDSYVQSLVGSAASVAPPETRAPTAAPVEVSAPAKKEEPKKAEPPKEEEVREFVAQMQGANLAEVEKKSLEIVAQAAPEKQKAAAEAGKRVYAQTFSERDPVIADFVQECADLVDGNPRQIKRYVNVFRFYSTLRYGLRADGLAKAEELPSDKMLAKFVALSIQWPHAMDCLRGRHHVESDGRAVSRLEFLEGKSLEMNEDDAGADEKWKEAVGEKGMKLEPWAEARAFRVFLARGEMLGKSAGHGLW